MQNKVEEILSNTIDNLRTVVASDNITGKPIFMPDGMTIIPLTKISIAIASGGGEYGQQPKVKQDDLPFAGGGGGGLSITPMGFLVCYEKENKLIKVDDGTSSQKFSELINNVIKTIKK